MASMLPVRTLVIQASAVSLLIVLTACGTSMTNVNGIDYVTGSTSTNLSTSINAPKSISGELAKDTSIEGVLYKQGTHVTLDDGRLKYVRLAAPTLIQGRLYASELPNPNHPTRNLNEEVVFAENGKVWSGMLGAGTTIDGNHFPPGTTLFFASSGDSLEHVNLRDIVAVRGIRYVGALYFREKGMVEYGWLAEDQNAGFKTLLLKGGTKVAYWPSGILKSGTVATYVCMQPYLVDCSLDEQGHPKGAVISPPGRFIVFDEKGKLSELRKPTATECLSCQ